MPSSITRRLTFAMYPGGQLFDPLTITFPVFGSSHMISLHTRVDDFALALGFAFVVAITEYLRHDSFPTQHTHQSGDGRDMSTVVIHTQQAINLVQRSFQGFLESF